MKRKKYMKKQYSLKTSQPGLEVDPVFGCRGNWEWEFYGDLIFAFTLYIILLTVVFRRYLTRALQQWRSFPVVIRGHDLPTASHGVQIAPLPETLLLPENQSTPDLLSSHTTDGKKTDETPRHHR